MLTYATTIHAATSADTGVLRQLVSSSHRPRPRGPLLVAAYDGRLIAAIALSSGAVITDHSTPAADAVRRLRRRRYQLLRQGGDVGAARTLLRRLAAAPVAV